MYNHVMQIRLNTVVYMTESAQCERQYCSHFPVGFLELTTALICSFIWSRRRTASIRVLESRLLSSETSLKHLCKPNTCQTLNIIQSWKSSQKQHKSTLWQFSITVQESWNRNSLYITRVPTMLRTLNSRTLQDPQDCFCSLTTHEFTEKQQLLIT